MHVLDLQEQAANLKHSIFGLCVLIFRVSHAVLVMEGGRILLCLNLLDVNSGIYTSVSNCTKWLSTARCVEFALLLLLRELIHHLRKHCIGCKMDKKFEETSEVFLAS